MNESSTTLGLVLAFAGVCLTQLAGLVAVWLDVRRRQGNTDGRIEVAAQNAGVAAQHAGTAASEASTAASAAATAAARVEPVSNGFANEMRSGLAGIQAEQERARGERQEDRAVTREALRLIGDHLSAHAAANVHTRTQPRG